MSQSTNAVEVQAADQRAAQAVVRHHSQLAEALDTYTSQLLDAADRGDGNRARQVREDLVKWLHGELLPHAHAEEDTLYRAAATRPGVGLLIDGMINEHHAIGDLIGELENATALVRMAAAARALNAMFRSHLGKENDLVVPLLVQAQDVSLAALLEGMHELIGGHDHDSEPAESGGCGCGGCGCGGGASEVVEDAPMLSIDPRIDVREIPHEHRHATVLQAVDNVPLGGALVLVAPHAPKPLLDQIQARHPGQFGVEWLQSGPQVWQVRLQRASLPE